MFGNINLAKPENSRSFTYAFSHPQASGKFTGLASAKKHSSLNPQSSDPAKSMVMSFETSDGKKGELHWSKDMLASVGGSGGTVNAKYHESSTEDDPVAVIWGTDSNGSAYETIVHMNDVDPRHASPGEMIALNAHLSKANNKTDASPIALWTSIGSFGVKTKTDYESYYNDYIAMQKQAGNLSGAALYQLQLEQFLFSYHQASQTEPRAF